jgi:hypothetical protein
MEKDRKDMMHDAPVTAQCIRGLGAEPATPDRPTSEMLMAASQGETGTWPPHTAQGMGWTLLGERLRRSDDGDLRIGY